MDAPYRPLPFGAALLWTGIAAAWLSGLAIAASAGPGWGAAALAGAALGTVVFGGRLAHEVEVTADGHLAWRTLVGGGRVPLADVRRVRPARWQRTLLYLEVDGARGPVVASGRGVAAFVDALRASRPDLDVELGAWISRLVDLDRTRAR